MVILFGFAHFRLQLFDMVVRMYGLSGASGIYVGAHIFRADIEDGLKDEAVDLCGDSPAECIAVDDLYIEHLRHHGRLRLPNDLFV